MANSDSDIDDAAASLSEQTLKRIDQAFDRAISESLPEDQRPQKRRRITEDAEPAGGFILDDDGDEEPGGGFVPESNDERAASSPGPNQPTHIPLSLIPRALQLLDFNPSDAEVLSVFANAASVWPKNRPPSDPSNEDGDEPEQAVSRRDWRAVCAALIPINSPLSSEDSRADSDSGSSSGISSADLDESESSEDEYIPETRSSNRARPQRRGTSQSKSKKPRRTRDSSPAISANTTGGTRSLTARQKQDTLAAFALFFPGTSKETRSDLSEDELSTKKLTIRDVANAAASIKEKITAEEIIEMLSFFSSSSSQSNPSLSFQEFQQMMVAAKLA